MAADGDPIRSVAQYRVDRLRAEDGVPAGDSATRPEGEPPTAAGRMEERASWVEELVRQSREQSRELEAFQRELRQLGVQLKDSRLGLVDFPSEIGGRTVLLCWRLGEPEVQFWHEVNAGYAGRQPLSPALVS